MTRTKKLVLLGAVIVVGAIALLNFYDIRASVAARMPRLPMDISGVSGLFNRSVATKPITLTTPLAGATVGFPLKVAGHVDLPGGFSVVARLRDADGDVLAEEVLPFTQEGAGENGEFSAEISYAEPKGKAGTLEVFEYNKKKAAESNVLTLPVIFTPADAMSLKLFFGNSVKDPDSEQCGETYIVERRILPTVTPARAALKELLRGTTMAEEVKGFYTDIEKGIDVNDIRIENGVATVDFSESLVLGDKTACRSAGVVSQVKNTLMQFGSIRDVVIMVNGGVMTDDTAE